VDDKFEKLVPEIDSFVYRIESSDEKSSGGCCFCLGLIIASKPQPTVLI
jgi:hypothetical protein